MKDLKASEGKRCIHLLMAFHQVRIAKEDHHKTTFLGEWGCYQYTVIPFGLKNPPALFSRIVASAFKYFIHKFLEVYFDDWTVFGSLRIISRASG